MNCVNGKHSQSMGQKVSEGASDGIQHGKS